MFFMRYSFYIIVLFIFLIACSRAFEPNVRTGAGQMMSYDSPEVWVSALGYFDDENHPTIEIDIDIGISSLIFSTVEDGILRAGADVQFNIYKLDDENDERGMQVESITDTVNVQRESERITSARETYTLSRQVKVDPGKYRVETIVTDKDSGRQTQKNSNVIVNDPDSDEPVLTHVNVNGKEENKTVPVITYSIPSRLDSLSFFFKVGGIESLPVEVTMRLIKFESDQEPARGMGRIQPGRGSVYFQGINYNGKEIVSEQSRVLEDESGTIEIEHHIPLPSRGAYRFEVTLSEQGNLDDPEMLKARDFGVMSPNFPNVESLREMAQAMVYLMSRDDYEEMMSISDVDSLRSAMDKFWLQNLESQARALQVIEKYFNRVEEANRLFTNFKEGWKTDKGMIYILFGQPFYKYKRTRSMTWVYGYDVTDSERVFTFEQARMASDQNPFTNYALRRHRNYRYVQNFQQEHWLDGTILIRPFF